MAGDGAYLGCVDDRGQATLEHVSAGGSITTMYRFANADVPTALAFSEHAATVAVGTSMGACIACKCDVGIQASLVH